MSAAAPDRTQEFEAAGLLEGLDDGAREARLRLLQDLAAEGVSIEEMKVALAEGRLALLPVERILAGEPRLTPREVAEAAGIPVEFFIAMRQAVGIARPDPDERVCDAQDVSSAQAFAQLRGAGFPEDSLLDVTRVLGAGLAQTADAMRMAMADRAARSGRGRVRARDPQRRGGARAAAADDAADGAHPAPPHPRPDPQPALLAGRGGVAEPAPGVGRVRRHGGVHPPRRAHRPPATWAGW